MAKQYCVIEFKELPRNCDKFHRLVVVPRHWVSTFSQLDEEGPALVKYPDDEGKYVTKARVENYENFMATWGTYLGHIFYSIADRKAKARSAYCDAKDFLRLKKKQYNLIEKWPTSKSSDVKGPSKNRDTDKDASRKAVNNCASSSNSGSDNSKGSVKPSNSFQDKAPMKPLADTVTRYHNNYVASTTMQQLVQVTQTKVALPEGSTKDYNSRKILKTRANGHDCSGIPTKKRTMETAVAGKFDTTAHHQTTTSTLQIVTHRRIETHENTARENRHELTTNCPVIVRVQRYTTDVKYNRCEISLSKELFEGMTNIARNVVRSMFMSN